MENTVMIINNLNSPLISVIIPYYNCAKYIEDALNSLNQQSYKNFEVILVNDGSNKANTVFIEALLNEQPNIQYLYQDNQGVSSARNLGAKMATGEFLLFLDADNKIHPSYLEKTINILINHPNCKIAHTKAEFFEGESGEWVLPPFTGLKNLLQGNMIDTLALIRHADFIKLGGFDENLTSHEDWDYWIRLLQDGGDVIRLDEILYSYRKRLSQDSLMDGLAKNPNKLNDDWQKIYLKHSHLYLLHGLGYFELIKINQQFANQAHLLDTQIKSINLNTQNQESTLNHKLDELSAQIISLKSKNKNLLSQLTQQDKAKKTLLSEKDQLILEIEYLDSQLSFFQNENLHAAKQKELLTREIEKCNAQLIELKNENARAHYNLGFFHHSYHQVDYKFKKYKSLMVVRIIKPFIKIEQNLHSLNHYRKAFIILMREQGGMNNAYLFLKNHYNEHGSFKSVKTLLKDILTQNKTSTISALPDTPKPVFDYVIPSAQFIKQSEYSLSNKQKQVKVICFYLPQFHTFAENDKWWGAGFTEWSNVKPAKSQFIGHYQPHIPHKDIGYYNLLNKETQLKQIEMAKKYGIEGFCYYLYWFTGHRLMETPLDNMLSDKDIDFPFCICWANENWTRRWDGLDQDVLIAQEYSDSDDINFISHIKKYLTDSRYIKINGKPLLVIYRPNLFPDMKKTAHTWRTWCKENGVGEIYLAYPQSFEIRNPEEYDFDASIEFPPNNPMHEEVQLPLITDSVTLIEEGFKGEVYDWRFWLKASNNYSKTDYTLFRSVVPSWDNTARKKNKGIIFQNSHPELFEKYLINAFTDTISHQENKDERLVFINAWNEWAEGAHLEPDIKYGYGWLQAVQNAHLFLEKITKINFGIVIHAFYPEILEQILEELLWAKTLNNLKLYVTTPFDKETEVQKILNQYKFHYDLLPCKNLGRDILPFLKILPKIKKDKIEYLLKVHTKRSPHREDGNTWRGYIFEQLLSQSGFNHAMQLFLSNEKVGMVSPNGHLAPLNNYWGSNKELFYGLCTKKNLPFSPSKDYKFVAGTMFYAKMTMFDKIINLNLKDEDFQTEAGQLDGTLSHVLERYFGVLVTELNHDIKEVGIYKNTSNDNEIRFD